MERPEQLKQIKRKIQEHGYHKYYVLAGTCPRFAYTIGHSEKLKAELVFAGAIYFSMEDVKKIIDSIS